jgi:hypothetical protein
VCEVKQIAGALVTKGVGASYRGTRRGRTSSGHGASSRMGVVAETSTQDAARRVAKEGNALRSRVGIAGQWSRHAERDAEQRPDKPIEINVFREFQKPDRSGMKTSGRTDDDATCGPGCRAAWGSLSR